MRSKRARSCMEIQLFDCFEFTPCNQIRASPLVFIQGNVFSLILSWRWPEITVDLSTVWIFRAIKTIEHSNRWISWLDYTAKGLLLNNSKGIPQHCGRRVAFWFFKYIRLCPWPLKVSYTRRIWYGSETEIRLSSIMRG
jgi:hypothetical protein